MATLTTNAINRNPGLGRAAVLVAAGGAGDAMACGAGMMLLVVNGGGSSITVTLNVPTTRVPVSGVAITSPQITVPNGSEKTIGPIDGGTFMDPVTGLCSITYSAVTSVTVAALDLRQG